MGVKWYPDTCDCVIEFTGNFEDYNLIKFHTRCKIHGSETFENIYKNHHKPFNTKIESDALKEQHKADEKDHIRKIVL